MSDQGILGFYIRFASWIPFLILGIDFSLYTDVRNLEVLSTMPQGPKFLQGLKIGGIIVCTGSKTARMG